MKNGDADEELWAAAHKAGEGTPTPRGRAEFTPPGGAEQGDGEAGDEALERLLESCVGEPLQAGRAGSGSAVAEPAGLRAAEAYPSRGALHAACALADEEAVDRLLEQDPEGATRPLASERVRWRGAEPLAVLCAAGRRAAGADAGPRVRIAERLLSAGANPAARLVAFDLELGWRSALCGTLGSLGSVELARRLVAAGAEPDSECLLAAARLPRGDQAAEVLAYALSLDPPSWQLAGALAERVAAHDTRGVALLLDAGADASSQGAWGGHGSLLHHAVWHGAGAPMLELLLERGADPGATDRYGRTPHAIARCCGHASAARLLAPAARESDATQAEACRSDSLAGLGPNERWILAALQGKAREARQLRLERDSLGRGNDAWLSWVLGGSAAPHARPDRLPLLLALGLNPNVPDDQGRLPLHLASRSGDARSVERLLIAGADPDGVDGAGRTALTWCLRTPEVDVRRGTVRALLASGPKPSELDGFPCGDAPLDDELARAGFRSARDRSADFELAAEAVAGGDVQQLELLLRADPELVRARSPRRHRAQLLHYTAANGIEPERQRTPANAVDVLDLLLAAGADPNATCSTYGGGPAQTTLGLLVSSQGPAAAGLQGALVDRLCRTGADPNGLEDDGSPLATAIAFRCSDAVHALAPYARLDNVLFAAATGARALLEELLEPWAAEAFARTAETQAAPSGYRRCEVPWLQMARDPVVGLTQSLACAARFGHCAVVERLLALGLAPTTASPGYGPALHEAAYAGERDVAALLLERGAHADQRDPQHKATPGDWARKGGHAELGAWLDSADAARG